MSKAEPAIVLSFQHTATNTIFGHVSLFSVENGRAIEPTSSIVAVRRSF
jgi:hypothetical protein